MKIDLHVHLAGVGTQGSGCWASPTFQSRPVFRLLKWWYGITEERMRTCVDQDWVDGIASQVAASELDAAVVLGFDGVYDARGELDRERSQLVVPPAWVFESCRRHPGRLLPGPSIHPFRRDAAERLDEAIENGAVLLKWLPAAQGIDPSSPRLASFYRRMADAALPLLVHSGGSEQTFAEIAPDLKDLGLLRRPLDAGVTVVCAHAGVPVWLTRDPDQIPLLRELLRRYPNLWLDNSGMANPTRFHHLARVADDAELRQRVLHGSDYPVPVHALYYPARLGPRTVWRIERIVNPFDRDVALKRALGYPEETLTRAVDLLPNLDRWVPTT